MIQFPISKGLNVRSTTFPHKDIHRDLVFSGRQDSEPNRSLWITGPDSLPAATAQYRHAEITPLGRQLLKMGT